jgi:uridine phosphorylase
MRAKQLRDFESTIPETELILNPDGSVYHLGITGDQLAEDIWIVGDPERVPLISMHFDRVDVRVQRREFVVHTGELNGKRLTVVSSGIGVDNIDIVINELDAAVNVDPTTRKVRKAHRSLRFLRLGTSGAIQPDIELGTVIASRYAFAKDGVPISYEFEFSEDEEVLLGTLERDGRASAGLYAVSCGASLLTRYPIHDLQGITYTANGFYGPQGRSVRLKSKQDDLEKDQAFQYNGFRITNYEMECAGLYGMASLLGHEALTCCVILANRANRSFASNAPQLAEKLIQSALHAF